MCNKIKCAKQYTEDFINSNINRDVQEDCANKLYRVYTVHVAAIRMLRIVNVLQLINESCKCL